MVKRILLLVVFLAMALAATTYIALESGGVVVVETQRYTDEEPRYTHVWFIEEDGKLYLEAGHPDNPWVRDLQHLSNIKLTGEGFEGEYAFHIRNTPADHFNIRSMMHAKYGWRDWWISLIFDTSQSQLIELKPLSAPNTGLQPTAYSVRSSLAPAFGSG